MWSETTKFIEACKFIHLQLDGKIVAPTSSKAWGSGLLQWLEFTKLVGITIKGSGTIDGSGAVWWQDSPYDDPIDDESKLIVPINRTVTEKPPIPVTFSPTSHSLEHIWLSWKSLLINKQVI